MRQVKNNKKKRNLLKRMAIANKNDELFWE